MIAPGRAGLDPDDPRAGCARSVPDALDGARLDRAVAELFELPMGAARRLLAAGRVRVDDRLGKKGHAVRIGQRVLVEGSGRWLSPALDPRLTVLYQDADVVVVDKPAGIPCHPLVPGAGGTLVDAVAALFPEVERASPEALRDAGLVHRLDTGTSGCLAIARHPAAWRELRAALSSDQVEKRYLALVNGAFAQARVLTDPIGHDPADPSRMRIDAGGRPARSELSPVLVGDQASLVEIVMQGGRRHQLRVHLARCGHPIVGDVLYGAPAASDAAWPLLHARSLALPGRPRVQAPLPPPMRLAAAARGLAVGAEPP